MHVLRDPRIGHDYQAIGWPYYSFQEEDHMLCYKMILINVHSPFQSVVYTLECLGSSHLYHVCATFETTICIHPF